MSKFNKKLIKILTPCKTPEKQVLMGNEAVARGAIEAGVRGVFAYPGTPSTEISEVFKNVSTFQIDPEQKKTYPELTKDPIYFEYSINEKVALEKAIAYSLGNRNAMCCMKNVGMNVASDPLITIAYQTIGKSLVVVVCDDPGCFSSSNEQDSRYWGKIASVPVLNPATAEDSYKMTIDAFALSELLKLPVIVRMSTRVDHSRCIVSVGNIFPEKINLGFNLSPQHINIPAKTATAHKNLLMKMESEVIFPFQKNNNRIYFKKDNSQATESAKKLGVITCGVANSYALEIIYENDISEKLELLKIGITHPISTIEIIDFLNRGFKKILILEELDPIVENEVRIIAQRNNINVEILGKGYISLTRVGEYSLDIVRKAIEEFADYTLNKKAGLPAEGKDQFLANLPPRPPALCPGCPHRATFFALKLAADQVGSRPVLCGDIGCFALGAFPPFQMIDTIHHMGMSIPMAQGLSEVLKGDQGDKQKIVALVGDGTFYHSGVASLLNAVYTRANITVIIFDNRTVGMTGHQDNPGAVSHNKNEEVDLSDLLRGLGVKFVESIDPNNLKQCYKVIKEALAFQGVATVVAKSPCVFLPVFKDGINFKKGIEVDPSLCNTCHNQSDSGIFCSRELTAENTLAKAKAKFDANHHIPANEQLCPANICNHGFFNAILMGNYKEAINVVRDKTLFARICGDICPRPCEYLFRKSDQPVVPIRQLKKYIAGLDDNFDDFSAQKKQIENADKKDKNIAVIGAGPAGLSAAYDLIREGYNITIYERESEAGGLLKFAIPGFRMDKLAYDKEISLLTELGVTFKFNTGLGNGVELEQLSSDYDGVILAIGMGTSTTMQEIEANVPDEKRFEAIAFLRSYNDNTLDIKRDSTVFVIGGGNSAIDSARAAKEFGVKNVTIVYRRTREEMPAFQDEIEEAIAEGVKIINDTVISSCSINSDGRITTDLKSFKEKKDLGELTCDYIIIAIGQKGEDDVIRNLNLKTDWNNRIVDITDNDRSLNNVFVAGDICADNHISLIGAIGSGKQAAVRIRQLHEDYRFDYEGQRALQVLGKQDRSAINQTSFSEIELNNTNIDNEILKYDLYQACGKCDHCIENFGCPALIKVDGKVVIDDVQCNRCGLCIDVCLNNAIHWV
ncbi:MAG: FAD-dependent oxidoreductase [Calditrichaeota bacterium]|nr:FAD-dependent oxidoreductase [Calditrichota bacterium]